MQIDKNSVKLLIGLVLLQVKNLRAIKFRLLNNLINMNSSDPEHGTATEDIPVQYEGEEIEIGFNSKYILEMINQLERRKINS